MRSKCARCQRAGAPALGKPTMPTSATTRSSRCSESAWPGRPRESSFQFMSSTSTTSLSTCYCRSTTEINNYRGQWSAAAVLPSDL
jgi:hypothetical protein